MDRILLFFYISSPEAVTTTITNEKETLAYAQAMGNKRTENTAQIEILHQGDFIWFLSDCVMNVLSGVVPIKKVELKKFEKPLRKLADRRVEKRERIKVFRSDSGIRLIKLIALPCIAFLEQNAH